MPLAGGRSPQLRVRPDEIDVTFADVRGLDGVVEEVVQTLYNFLAYQRYRDGSAHRQLRRRPAEYTNLLIIAATNRAGSIPRCCHPGASTVG